MQVDESDGDPGTGSSSVTAPIVGGTVGAVALVGVLVVVLLLWRRRSHRKPSGGSEAANFKRRQPAGSLSVGVPAPVFGDVNDVRTRLLKTWRASVEDVACLCWRASVARAVFANTSLVLVR